MSDNQNNIIYSCPMHPEVQQNHKGVCPECGMWLVKEGSVASSEAGADDKNV